ncbi:MAG: hypothetical protein AAF628_29150 [Planctomycetota bacterium]
MRTLLLAALLLLPSCQSALHARQMWSDLAESGDVYETWGVAEEPPDQTALALPFRLGIAPPMVGLRQRFAGGQHRIGSWTEAEREAIEAAVEDFKAAGIVSEVVFLPRLLLGTPDQRGRPESIDRERGTPSMPALRRAAQATRVDAVLVSHSLSDVREGINLWALLDLTLIGAFLAPGHEYRSVTVSEALLLGAHGGELYAFAEAQAESSKAMPLSKLDAEGVAATSRLEAIESLAHRLLAQTERPGGEPRRSD